MNGETRLPDYLRTSGAVFAYVDPRATDTFALTAEPGDLSFSNGPALFVGNDRTDEVRSFAFEYTGTRSEGFQADIAAGPVEVEFTNATASGTRS